jgi:hypothetical protein
VQSSLVLVDVISQDPKNGLPVRDFTKEDFRVLDNRHEVPLATFDAGAHSRPVIVWLVVICNEQGIRGGSAKYVGKEALFRPAFDHLEKTDTIGVTHWCDNGETQIDLQPTGDRDSPIRVLAETLKPISFVGGSEETDAVGEETFRKMVRMLIKDAQRRNPQALPVLVFLHGDKTGQPGGELDDLVNDFLETSGIVFGIKDERTPAFWMPYWLTRERSQILHYMAERTGGEYFSVPPSEYSTALEKILTQLHFRYQLGFIPPAIDGKRHTLKVELTKAAHKKHKGARLRFRLEYIPLPEAPQWAR